MRLETSTRVTTRSCKPKDDCGQRKDCVMNMVKVEKILKNSRQLRFCLHLEKTANFGRNECQKTNNQHRWLQGSSKRWTAHSLVDFCSPGVTTCIKDNNNCLKSTTLIAHSLIIETHRHRTSTLKAQQQSYATDRHRPLSSRVRRL